MYIQVYKETKQVYTILSFLWKCTVPLLVEIARGTGFSESRPGNSYTFIELFVLVYALRLLYASCDFSGLGNISDAFIVHQSFGLILFGMAEYCTQS